MSNSNSTIYSTKSKVLSTFSPIIKNCMMGVRNMQGSIDIYIPFKDLQNGLSAEDVYRWVEIGNSLIFNSAVRKDYLSEPINRRRKFNEVYYKYLRRLSVVRKDLDVYTQDDAISADEGYLYEVNSEVQIKVTKGSVRGDTWYISPDDYQLVETRESLDEHLVKIYTEHFKVEKKQPNSFVITIDLDKCVSPQHKLAVLTFYRYLYSNRYPSIVKNTLLAIDAGVSNWNALMLAHAERDTNYTSYYGLTESEIRSFLPMTEVLANLKAGYNVNNSFTNNLGIGASIPSFKITPNIDFKFLEKQLLEGSARSIKVKCINTDGCSTITLNRTYFVVQVVGDNYKIEADDYCYRYFNKKRFKDI